MPPIALTVITPSLNHGRYIGDAVDSVRLRPDITYEHLVIDAASTDETHAELAKRPHISLHIEPSLDSHEALNFGIERAQGDIVCCLNSDDRYDDGALNDVVDLFQADPTLQLVCGGIRFFTDAAEGERDYAYYRHQDGDDMRLELTFGNPGFNSWFFRRSLLSRLGGFRPRFPFAADRDLLLRACALARPYPLPRMTYHYRVHEGSRTMDPRGTNRKAMIMDHLHIIAEQSREIWQNDPAMLDLLRNWDALERFKLVVRAVRYRDDPVMSSVMTTPWHRVPTALWLRRRWLRILAGEAGPDSASGQSG